MTKAEFHSWLVTTSPPREIVVEKGKSRGIVCYYTGCCLDKNNNPNVRDKFLLKCLYQYTAEREAIKYRRWLAEFEEAEEKKTAQQIRHHEKKQERP